MPSRTIQGCGLGVVFQQPARENIQTTLRRAYNNHVAHWNELRHLVSLGLTMREFNSPDGTKRLGSKLHYEIGCSMHQDYEENFSDEILVLGWGKMPHSVMLYSIGPGGEGLHGNDGCYAIGSGRDAAISTLFLLEHKASSHLQDAIYAVAAAKFSSESHGIGKSTTMWIARKRIDTDPADHPPGMPDLIIQETEINELRSVWERKGRPRIPIESRQFTKKITVRTKDDAVLDRQGNREFFEKLKQQSEAQKSEPEQS